MGARPSRSGSAPLSAPCPRTTSRACISASRLPHDRAWMRSTPPPWRRGDATMGRQACAPTMGRTTTPPTRSIPMAIGSRPIAGNLKKRREALLLCRLQRILDGLEGGELDVVEAAVHFLDLADVFIVNDVPRLRIDGHRSARAFPRHAFHRCEQRFAVGLAAGLFQRLVDEMHGIVAADGDEVRTLAVSLLKARDEGLVQRRVMHG